MPAPAERQTERDRQPPRRLRNIFTRREGEEEEEGGAWCKGKETEQQCGMQGEEEALPKHQSLQARGRVGKARVAGLHLHHPLRPQPSPQETPPQLPPLAALAVR